MLLARMLTRAVRPPRAPVHRDDAPVTTRSTVLLLSDDAMTLALLGLLVELAGFSPAFAAVGERAEDAMARVRPSLIVLLDDTLDAVRSDVFFARAARRRIAIAIFPGKTSSRDLVDGFGERGIPWFELPTDVANLERAITSASATRWWARGSERRALPAAERSEGGGLLFVDRSGRRWQVYDRRGSERRHPPATESGESVMPNVSAAADPAVRSVDAGPVTRLFVSNDGLSVAITLAHGEVGALSAGDLEHQFLRATPVG